jgi:hypothetical protein
MHALIIALILSVITTHEVVRTFVRAVPTEDIRVDQSAAVWRVDESRGQAVYTYSNSELSSSLPVSILINVQPQQSDEVHVCVPVVLRSVVLYTYAVREWGNSNAVLMQALNQYKSVTSVALVEIDRLGSAKVMLWVNLQSVSAEEFTQQCGPDDYLTIFHRSQGEKLWLGITFRQLPPYALFPTF